MKVGLFFGSFNPVHVGHMIIANYMVEYSDLDKVWMVVSPQNPFKNKSSLAKDHDRLYLVNLAIGDNLNILASNVEFSLSKPSYTIDTLSYLKEAHPLKKFSLIMGGDNLSSFYKWKNYKEILKGHEIYVYKRNKIEEHPLINHPKVKFYDAPLLDISATFIRRAIRDKKSVQYLVPEDVYIYLRDYQMYKK